jgi:hypothetical protein
MDFIRKYSDISDSLNNLYEKGLAKGATVGFSQMDNLISIAFSFSRITFLESFYMLVHPLF